MKCKVNDSPSGVRNLHPGLVSGPSPVARPPKEDVALSTRSNKSDKSEGSILRRSSRRATIERRVWAVPRKMAKPPLPSVKEKIIQQKSSKKEKEKKVQTKVQSKPSGKCKALADTKRGLVMTEETGNARRKIKKKEGMKNVDDNVGNTSDSITDASDVAESLPPMLEDNTLDKTEAKFQSSRLSMEKEHIENHDSNGGDTDSVRTGLPLLAQIIVDGNTIPSRTLSNDTKSDRGLEETLDTGEICLNKAIVEEVVSDFEISTSCGSSNAGNETSSRYSESTSHVVRNLEDVLGHSYSKLKSVYSDVVSEGITDQELTNDGTSDNGTDNDIKDYRLEKMTLGQEVESAESIGEEDSRQEEERGPEEGGEHTTDTNEVKLQNTRRISGDENEVNAKDNSDVNTLVVASAESPTGSRDYVHTLRNPCPLENRECEVLDSTAPTVCSASESAGVVDIGNDRAEETGADETEEDHVSLSVALAQLIDSGCGEAEGAETLTIHSVSPVIQPEQKERQEVVALEVNSKEAVPEKLGNNDNDDDDDDEDEEGELVIKEEDDEGEYEESDTDSEQEEDIRRQGDLKDSNIQECITLMKSGKFSEFCKDVKSDSDVERHIASPSPLPSKFRKQMPPLIKVSARPPAIKTPLKCPECPMQFCTVRSLLWHFGTHGARSRENCLPPILLQDLIVPWDKPNVSLFISQAADSEKSTEKTISSADASLAVPSSPDTTVKVDMIGKQDLIMTTQFLRTEDYTGSNGDVILKVPIPRLKPKSQNFSTFKKDKFVNILPKITNNDGQTSSTPISPHLAKIRPSGSPTPQITIHQNNNAAEVVSVKPQHPVQKITLRADNSAQQVHIKPLTPVSTHSAVQMKPMISSQSAVQIQPLISSSQPALQIQPLVSTSQSALQIQPLVSTSQSALQIQPLVSTSQSALQIQPLVSTSQSALQIQPLVSSSQSGLQIQPLVSSPQSALQIQPLVSCTPATQSIVTTTKPSSTTSHIALIPVDNLTAVGQNFTPRSKVVPPSIRMMAPSSLPVKTSTPVDGILEKDGLVMINSNLALRIVSSLPSTLDSGTSTTNTTTIRPIASHLTNNLTILPQVEGSKPSNSKKEGVKNPDILTIVPQIDMNKKVSLLKKPSQIPNTQVVSNPKTSASSQVVKLYLLQPKDLKNDDNAMKLNVTSESAIGMNGIEIPLPLPNGNESATSENGNSRGAATDEEEDIDDDCEEEEQEEEEEEEEEEDEGMVIDDEKEGDDDVMDPLSLCAVTMEDENLEASNSSSQADHFNLDSAVVSEDKVTIKKIIGKPKGKSNQGVDIVKYEARKYVCCYCNRRFGWSTDLKRHVILHTGEKPFQCKVCPTAFTRKFLLQNHMKRMHPDKCKMSDLWP